MPGADGVEFMNSQMGASVLLPSCGVEPRLLKTKEEQAERSRSPKYSISLFTSPFPLDILSFPSSSSTYREDTEGTIGDTGVSSL